MPGSIPREKRSGSSARVVGALPGRSLGRPAPRGRGLGPQSRAHRLYFQGRFFHHPRIYGETALFFCGEIMTQRPATAGPAAAAAAAAAAVHRMVVENRPVDLATSRGVTDLYYLL